MIIFRFLFVGYFFLLFSESVVAETVDDEIEWRTRDRIAQEIISEKLEQSKKPIQLPKVDILPILEDEETCFYINNIKVEGFLSEWALKKGQIYIGECVGLSSIQSYVRLINKKLLSEGYITSIAVLPEQNLSSKTLIIKVLEGKIEKVEFPQNYPFYWEYSIPLEKGNVLNLRDMEQAVDRLNRLRSQNIEFKIKPGLNNNESILIAEVKESKRWHIGASFDNSGSESTGEFPLSLNGTFDNVLFLQDSFSYSFSLAKKNTVGESNSASISWDIPLGYWLLSFSNSFSNYRQETNLAGTSFELSGNTNDKKFSLNYTYSRDNRTKTFLFGHIKVRERHNFFAEQEIEIQKRNITEIELGGSYERYVNGSAINISMSLHQGLNIFDATSLIGGDNEVAQSDYRFYSLNASINYPFSVFEKKMNYTGVFFTQYAETLIYSLDSFSIGGRYTIRGFNSNNGVNSDNGWRLRNDVLIPFNIGNIHLNNYYGFDVGQIYGEKSGSKENESDHVLAGLTIGIKGGIKNVNYDFFVSKPFLANGPYASSNNFELSMYISTQF